MSNILAAAARRARYTGLPLDRMIKSEEARRLRQIQAGQIPAALVHPTDVLALQTEVSAIPAADLIAAGEAAEAVDVPVVGTADKPKRKAPAKKAAAETPAEPVKEPTAADAGEVSKVVTDSLPQPSAEELVALSKKRNNIGKAVSYIDPFKKERQGKIAHVIPSNTLPSEMGIEAKGSKRRDHISYVVETDKGGMVWPNSTADDIGMKVIPTA